MCTSAGRVACGRRHPTPVVWSPTLHTLTARHDPALRPTLGALAPLRWAHPPPADADLPAYVRAGSALRRWGDARVVIQDDVRALAVLGAQARPLLLPANRRGERSFDDLHGNKRRKLDLESALVLPDGRLLAFGSGSRAHRERVVVCVPGAAPELRHAADLYAAIRACAALGGAPLNLEGAIVAGERVRFFQRGTGVARAVVNATVDLALDALLRWLDGAVPAPRAIAGRRYELGAHAGVAYGFTDAAQLADGRVAVLLCAEATDDPARDGVVAATAFGYLDADGGARIAPIRTHAGALSLAKLEGLEPAEVAHAFDVVTDADDPSAPAELGRLTVAQ